MKKCILCFTTILTLFFACCKKKSDDSAPPVGSLLGGFGIENVTGLFNITLSKNSDTTVLMPISARCIVHGNFLPSLTITFDSLPANMVSIVPSSYTGGISPTNTLVTDTFAFHIHAVDTGTFKIKVFGEVNGQIAFDSSFIIVQ